MKRTIAFAKSEVPEGNANLRRVRVSFAAALAVQRCAVSVGDPDWHVCKLLAQCANREMRDCLRAARAARPLTSFVAPCDGASVFNSASDNRIENAHAVAVRIRNDKSMKSLQVLDLVDGAMEYWESAPLGIMFDGPRVHWGEGLRTPRMTGTARWMHYMISLDLGDDKFSRDFCDAIPESSLEMQEKIDAFISHQSERRKRA